MSPSAEQSLAFSKLARELYAMDEKNRQLRAQSFDGVSSQYERARPSYPDETVRELIDHGRILANSRVLEIGAGSGKFTELLTPTGCSLTCVEPGANFVQILRDKFGALPRMKIVESSFEDYRPAERFDCIVAAQAFHWVDPAIRLERCSELLKRDGTLALVWNVLPRSTGPFWRAVYDLYDRVADGLRAPSHVDAPLESAFRPEGEELLMSELFHHATLRRVPWISTYTTEHYLELVDTYSNHRLLPEHTRKTLYKALEELCRAERGLISVQYCTLLYLAQKK